MKFRTELVPEKLPLDVSYQSDLLFLGSCFAQNIGAAFQERKFKTCINPFGVIYNSSSLVEAISLAVQDQLPNPAELVFKDEQYHSYCHHGDMSASSKQLLFENLSMANGKLKTALAKADVIFITLGTAWVFRNIKSQKVVANCHKVPAKEFVRELLSVDVIQKHLKTLLALIRSQNPKAKVIFTISPVRHLRDGLVNNNLGKAHLLAAVHQCVDQKQDFYFPAYELLIDDLRDYRFYADDLSHPNHLGIAYIFNQCANVLLNDATLSKMQQVEKLLAASKHKAFNPTSEKHQLFLKDLLAKMENLERALNRELFVDEKRELGNQLIA